MQSENKTIPWVTSLPRKILFEVFPARTLAGSILSAVIVVTFVFVCMLVLMDGASSGIKHTGSSPYVP